MSGSMLIVLQMSMLLNYLRWDRIKIGVFTVFLGIWRFA